MAGNDIADVGQSGDLANVADGIIATVPDGAGADLTLNGNTIRQSGTAQTKAGRFSAISVSAQTAVQASITGNVVEGASVEPLINFVSTGACVLSDNRCTVDGTATLGTLTPGAVGPLSPAVQVQAGTVIAGNNRISSAAGQIGLVITAQVNASQQPDATVPGQSCRCRHPTERRVSGRAMGAAERHHVIWRQRCRLCSCKVIRP